MLFLQTYQAGSLAPTDDNSKRYALKLEQGHGHTTYVSNRPDRIVGANPTPAFLDGLGFPEDNPPNAALVFESAPGETEVAVVELFRPVYDPIGQGVTYDVNLLADWQSKLDIGLSEAPTNLTTIRPDFGAASLFIDDCPEGDIFLLARERLCRDDCQQRARRLLLYRVESGLPAVRTLVRQLGSARVVLGKPLQQEFPREVPRELHPAIRVQPRAELRYLGQHAQ